MTSLWYVGIITLVRVHSKYYSLEANLTDWKYSLKIFSYSYIYWESKCTCVYLWWKYTSKDMFCEWGQLKLMYQWYSWIIIYSDHFMIWWRHQMETFSAILVLCAGNSPVAGEFPAQRPVTRSFELFFDLRLNKRWSKQSWGWWFETASRPLWRHYNESQ